MNIIQFNSTYPTLYSLPMCLSELSESVAEVPIWILLSREVKVFLSLVLAGLACHLSA